MVLTLEIAAGKDASPRTITVDTDDLTLGFLEDIQEAQDTKKQKHLNAALASFLGLTRDEVRAMTNRQFMQLARALNSTVEGAPVPNG